MTARARNQPTEKQVQARVKALYTAVGCDLWDSSDFRPTHITAGLPDLFVFCRRKRAAWTHETKAPHGVVSAGQQFWSDCKVACNETHLIGGYDVALDHLKSLGLIAKEAK